MAAKGSFKSGASGCDAPRSTGAIDARPVEHAGRVLKRLAACPVARYTRCVVKSGSTPADSEISKALLAFNPDEIHGRWEETLKRRASDPRAAITSARTLLEDTCKWILHEAGEPFKDEDDLPAPLALFPSGYKESRHSAGEIDRQLSVPRLRTRAFWPLTMGVAELISKSPERLYDWLTAPQNLPEYLFGVIIRREFQQLCKLPIKSGQTMPQSAGHDGGTWTRISALLLFRLSRSDFSQRGSISFRRHDVVESNDHYCFNYRSRCRCYGSMDITYSDYCGHCGSDCRRCRHYGSMDIAVY
jgi:hypothetical protein